MLAAAATAASASSGDQLSGNPAVRSVLFAIDVGGGDGMAPGLGVLVKYAVTSLVFALLGILVFGIAFWLITKMVPFSIRKEIEDDQNTALGIVIGAVIIGLSLIISAAIQG